MAAVHNSIAFRNELVVATHFSQSEFNGNDNTRAAPSISSHLFLLNLIMVATTGIVLDIDYFGPFFYEILPG